MISIPKDYHVMMLYVCKAEGSPIVYFTDSERNALAAGSAPNLDSVLIENFRPLPEGFKLCAFKTHDDSYFKLQPGLEPRIGDYVKLHKNGRNAEEASYPSVMQMHAFGGTSAETLAEQTKRYFAEGNYPYTQMLRIAERCKPHGKDAGAKSKYLNFWFKYLK